MCIIISLYTGKILSAFYSLHNDIFTTPPYIHRPSNLAQYKKKHDFPSHPQIRLAQSRKNKNERKTSLPLCEWRFNLAASWEALHPLQFFTTRHNLMARGGQFSGKTHGDWRDRHRFTHATPRRERKSRKRADESPTCTRGGRHFLARGSGCWGHKTGARDESHAGAARILTDIARAMQAQGRIVW